MRRAIGLLSRGLLFDLDYYELMDYQDLVVLSIIKPFWMLLMKIWNMNNKAERIVVPEVSVTPLMSSLSISVN